MRKALAVGLLLMVLLSLALRGRPKPRKPHATVDEKKLQGVIRTKYDSPAPTKAQLDRRARSNSVVKGMGLPCMENLPVVEDEKDIAPRGREEVARRCLAVAICAAKGETRFQAMVEKLIERHGASEFFSPQEKAFVLKPSPTDKECANFAWRSECVHVLLWALGYVDELKAPNQTCDVANEMKIIWSWTPERFLADAKPRPLSEVLNQADLYYRLHWAAIELRLKNRKSEAANVEIIMERHRALNWLIRYMNQEWDEVTTDT